MAQTETHSFEAPGCTVHYDVRTHSQSRRPTLLIVGSPMGAMGFQHLADTFAADRTVVTFDPRGVGRSKRTDGALQTHTEEHADDLRRLIAAVSAQQQPVDVFASSGGAVNALALAAKYPELVRVVVAHEPPLADVLPDRAEALATCDAIRDTYYRRGHGAGMAHFIAMVSHPGPFPAGFARQPGPDPAAFGLPAADDGVREDALLGLNMPTTPGYRPDYEALRTVGPKLVIGVGTTSANAVAGRAAAALGERLGLKPVVFPAGHDGFRSRQDGQQEEFAATLRQILDG